MIPETSSPPASAPASPYINVDQAAEYLQLNATYLRRIITPKRIPHRRHGKDLLFVPRELDAWLKRRTMLHIKKQRKKVTRRKKSAA